jgi:hypothetical protein
MHCQYHILRQRILVCDMWFCWSFYLNQLRLSVRHRMPLVYLVLWKSDDVSSMHVASIGYAGWMPMWLMYNMYFNFIWMIFYLFITARFSPGDTNMVLQEFEKCGIVLRHVPDPRDANWMHILYQVTANNWTVRALTAHLIYIPYISW